MSEMSRERLLSVVREVYEARDPVPAGLVERMQAAAAAEDAGLGTDLELMLLVEAGETLAGTRGETDLSDRARSGTGSAGVPRARRDPARRIGAAPYTLRFVLGEIDLLVRVAPAEDGDGSRIDGWTVPPEAMTVRALLEGEATRSTVVGDTGRFELTGLRPGLLRLRFEPHDGSRPPFATPTFEI